MYFDLGIGDLHRTSHLYNVHLSAVDCIYLYDVIACTLTFSDEASRDLRLLVTFFNSSSRSLHLLPGNKGRKVLGFGISILTYTILEGSSHVDFKNLCLPSYFSVGGVCCTYSSETSALSSALSSSPSRITSLRAT